MAAHSNLVGRVVAAEFAAVADDLSNQIGSGLAGRLGLDVAGTPVTTRRQSDHPVTKGVKGIGRGIKKLFGRGKNQ